MWLRVSLPVALLALLLVLVFLVSARSALNRCASPPRLPLPPQRPVDATRGAADVVPSAASVVGFVACPARSPLPFRVSVSLMKVQSKKSTAKLWWIFTTLPRVPFSQSTITLAVVAVNSAAVVNANVVAVAACSS